jgi:hypothetical protein
MDALSMMKTAAVLLAIAALGGLLMAGIRFSGAERPPSSIAMLHGLLAAAALTLLIYAAVVAGIPQLALVGTGVLVVVALVGVALNILYHSRLLPIPKAPIVIHGLAAVAGFALLVLALMGTPA